MCFDCVRAALSLSSYKMATELRERVTTQCCYIVVLVVVIVVLLPLLESRSVSRERRFVTSRQKERGNYYKQI